MAEWKIYEADTPQCTDCGMWMPFARYRRGQGTNARKITDYCPYCGGKMTAMRCAENANTVKAHGKTTEYATPVVSRYGFPEHRTEKPERRIDNG